MEESGLLILTADIQKKRRRQPVESGEAIYSEAIKQQIFKQPQVFCLSAESCCDDNKHTEQSVACRSVAWWKNAVCANSDMTTLSLDSLVKLKMLF